MVHLSDIRYVRLGTRDLLGASRYACQVLGLELGREEAGCHYFRSDDRDHTLVYFEGDPADHTVGFELASAAELAEAAALLSNQGYAITSGSAAGNQARRVHSFVNFRDPTGNSIDLVYRPHHHGRRHWPSRDAGVTGFSHIGLHSTNPARDEQFWTTLMGARVSDRIGEAPLLRIDEVHHKIAIFPSQRAGVQHINHQVASIDDVMRAWYQLKSQGVRIVFGPGRHPTSGACFLYFEGPDGMIYEYSTGVRCFTAEEDRIHQPRQFAFASESFCMWGSRPDIAEFRNVET
jgi:2,3-dihydroxy-p-cumate/2,3-dihydroxybenzoate 3,4-dioxygenase